MKTDGATVTVNNDGNLTVVTGNITKASDDVKQPNAGKVTVDAADANKVATVKNVADAINSAGWMLIQVKLIAKTHSKLKLEQLLK